MRQITVGENNLTLGADELRKLQWRKLKELLCYAYQNCPLYKEKYDKAGVKPKDILDFNDFRRIPFLEKSEIRGNLENLIPTKIDRKSLEIVHTSGTTGVPLRIYRDRLKKDLMFALFLRTIRFWGCDMGTKTAWFWGLPKELERISDYRYQSRLQRFLKNVTWFNVFDMTRDNMIEFAAFFNRFHPRLIIGYVNAIYDYAKFLEENSIKISEPRAIWLTAEPSGASLRKTIEKTFGAKTYNQYGTSEILHIATECRKRTGMHIHADARYVEILDSNGAPVSAGEIGNIVVTDLENRAMPLIRYKNGDMASWRDACCECGLNLPLMNDVVGRVFDIVKLRNGKRVYGHMFEKILRKYVGQIRQFQIHQISLDRIIVRVVPEKLENFDKFRLDVVSAFKKHTGNSVNYSFELAENIEKEKSGKFRFVKSDL